MKRKRHTSEQIIRKLREADGLLAEGKTIAEVGQRLEISDVTLSQCTSPRTTKGPTSGAPPRADDKGRGP